MSVNRIAVTIGDPAGIGPEIILKSLSGLTGNTIPLIIGDVRVLDSVYGYLPALPRYSFKTPGHGLSGDIEFLDLGMLDSINPGFSDRRCGRAAYQYIIEALKYIFTGSAAAIVTCPISKASLGMAGIYFPGHTEMLAYFGGVDTYIMMLANPKIRVSLVTIHIPINAVPSKVTESRVFDCIRITSHSLEERLALRNPSIKVCGLNPHAGEKGVMGNEEDVIVRAIERARSSGINVSGPFPADSLFHRIDCDAYIAMYHDQGLIPVKTLDFERTVNITFGLPFVRTSPGHGTGFDIAGKGIADPTSFIEAYKLAAIMAEQCTQI